jgi:hypothetical protein
MVVLLSDIRNQVLARADMSNTGFVSTTELNFYINQSYYELYDIIIEAFDDYYINYLQFTLDGIADGYSMPDVIYKLRGVDMMISGPDSWVTLTRYNFNDRNKYNAPFGVFSRFPYQTLQYSWTGSQIKVIPTQENAGTYKLTYIPNLTPLDDGYNTNLDPILEKWVDYIIVDSAIKCMAKEESDPSILMAQKQAMLTRIQKMSPDKDDAMPKYVSDSYNNGNGNIGGNFGGGWY